MQNKIKTLSSELPKRQDILNLVLSYEDMSGVFDLPSPIGKDRRDLYKNYYTGIGNSDIYRVPLQNDNFLHIKMEYSNSQGNSHYSRLWIPYLFIAETLGLIKPGESKLLEVTSGSSGIALAMACKVFGYDLTMVIPNMLPKGRIEPMQDFNAELIEVDGYIDTCVTELKRMLTDEKDSYFAPNHSNEGSDFIIHIFKRIASEYLQRFGEPDFAILGLGNGSTVESMAKTLKSESNNTSIISYHPSLKHNNIVLGLLSRNLRMKHIDPAKELSDEIKLTSLVSLNRARELFRHDTEISNLGHSSLYAIDIANQLSKKTIGKRFLTIGYDKIDRYLN